MYIVRHIITFIIVVAVVIIIISIGIDRVEFYKVYAISIVVSAIAAMDLCDNVCLFVQLICRHRLHVQSTQLSSHNSLESASRPGHATYELSV